MGSTARHGGTHRAPGAPAPSTGRDVEPGSEPPRIGSGCSVIDGVARVTQWEEPVQLARVLDTCWPSDSVVGRRTGGQGT